MAKLWGRLDQNGTLLVCFPLLSKLSRVRWLVLKPSRGLPGNGKVSLSELDTFVTRRYPLLRSRPTLAAFKRTTSREGGGDGDAFVVGSLRDWQGLYSPELTNSRRFFIQEKHEFKALLRNLFFFNRAWEAFLGLDQDGDRRLTLAEFNAGLPLVGLHLPEDEAAAEFASLDANQNGIVVFEEFCMWLIKKKVPVD